MIKLVSRIVDIAFSEIYDFELSRTLTLTPTNAYKSAIDRARRRIEHRLLRAECVLAKLEPAQLRRFVQRVISGQPSHAEDPNIGVSLKYSDQPISPYPLAAGVLN